MTMSLVQNDTTQTSTLQEYCSSVGGTIEAGRQAEVGVSAGTSEVSFTVASGASTDAEFQFECVIPDDSTTGAGTWTVPIDFTTGAMTAILDEVHICQVRSSSNIATIGSTTGIGYATNGGATSVNVTGSAITFVNGDYAVITLVFNETGGHSNQTVGITPNSTITSPFTAPAPSGWGGLLSNKRSRLVYT